MESGESGAGAQRVGNAERQDAVAALGEHTRAGRLTAAEYEKRSGSANGAVTWADLDALFTDLPAPHPRAAVLSPTADRVRAGSTLPRPWAGTLVALSPFVATVLFFATGYQWWWWLLVPASGIIVYGPRERRR